jgi:hypothetical protein
MGTLTLCIQSPFGLCQAEITLPTGSGKAATARRESAISFTRLRSSASLSSIAAGSFARRAAARSRRLAAIIESASFSNAAAMAFKAPFLTVSESPATANEACLADAACAAISQSFFPLIE